MKRRYQILGGFRIQSISMSYCIANNCREGKDACTLPKTGCRLLKSSVTHSLENFADSDTSIDLPRLLEAAISKSPRYLNKKIE